MTNSSRDHVFSGVLTPVVTPFDRLLAPDSKRFVSHCKWLINHGVGLAIFGTNSEGNSLSVSEKVELMDEIVDSGIDPQRLMPGTGCCALSDTVRLTRHAVTRGCGGVLMLPPFYYKNVTEDGLFRSFAETIERVGSDALRIYLYNIPPVAQVGISLSLIERLIRAYPKTIAGIKDSSGLWDNTKALHAADFDNFQVFVGSEAFLLQNMRAGGAGCISATANVNPAAIHDLFEHWQDDDAIDQQSGLNRVRAVFSQYPMIPALKAATAYFSGDNSWQEVRPPLIPLSDSQSRSLMSALDNIGFAMTGLSG